MLSIDIMIYNCIGKVVTSLNMNMLSNREYTSPTESSIQSPTVGITTEFILHSCTRDNHFKKNHQTDKITCQKYPTDHHR